MNENLLTYQEVASALKVHAITVHRWCKSDLLKCIKLGPVKNAPVRITQAELERFMREYQ